jgi:hypothetical protein
VTSLATIFGLKIAITDVWILQLKGENMSAKPKGGVRNLALSVRQPLAELIVSGKKKIEHRSRSTKIRERVYIYASQKPNLKAFKKIGKEPGDFHVGVLVGSVEIVGCREKPDEYEWLLANPKRLKRPIKPDNRPQPVWFKPFKE